MLRAMVQLAPRRDGEAGLDPARAALRTLAEHPDPGDRAYVLSVAPDGSLQATALEVDGTSRWAFPFRKPTGSQSAQVGPVLKRSYSPQEGVGPKESILGRTLEHFARIAASDAPVAAVYRRCLDALGGANVATLTARLVQALESIPERKTGKALYVSLGPPPGADPIYAAHLLDVIRGQLYGIDEASPPRPCPVCGVTAPLGATALRGAKCNFLNDNNHGVFPGMDSARAEARFALCARCADGIAATYIGRKKELRVVVAGSAALVLPEVISLGDTTKASEAVEDVLAKYRAGRGSAIAEGDLLEVLADTNSLVNFHILWASTGDALDKVSDFIADVPCTRLGVLSAVNLAAKHWSAPVFPPRAARVRDFDLRLSLLAEVLKYPGGARVKRRNDERLASLRRQVARAVYLGTSLPPAPLFSVLREIIADHLVDPTVDEKYLARNLTQLPPDSAKGPWLNAAAWVRHVALLLHYLRHLKVLPPMQDNASPPPRSARVRAFLDEATGADTDAKRFALLLGVLFGQLLRIQGDKRVNVRANALTWLRRGTLSGADLPGLYARVRGKFADYEAERSPALREVVTETSRLGTRLGTAIPLDADTTMYFLFLGQSLAAEVLTATDSQKD